MQHLAQHSQ